MNFNKHCKLFLKDLFSYDISACHYNIIKRLNYDMSNIPTDKFERNKHIGMMMRENKRLTNTLRNITESMISEYLLVNKIEDEHLIIRQYDGFISTKPLKILDLSIPIDLRSSFTYMIISSDRKWYIALDSNDKLIAKGIPHYYDEIGEIYKKLLSLNYLSRSEIFKCLQKIKEYILAYDNPSMFCIPGEDDKYTIFLKGYGDVVVGRNLIRILDTEDVDKQKYFDFFIRPFTESICIEFL